LFALIATLSSICLYGQAHAYTRTDLSPSTADASDYSNIDADALTQLYSKPAKILWIRNNSLTGEAYAALNFIKNANNHGLEPNNYHFQQLQQLNPSNSAESDIFDILLSDGLIKLIRDISLGHLDPTTVDPKWTIPRATFDAPLFLQKALISPAFASSLHSLIPTSEQYQQLTQAITLYQNIIDDGGWKKIPKVKKLRVGDSHYIIALIRQRFATQCPSRICT